MTLRKMTFCKNVMLSKCQSAKMLLCKNKHIMPIVPMSFNITSLRIKDSAHGTKMTISVTKLRTKTVKPVKYVLHSVKI
jgi:hypothetical protein